jgi:hypothetical protein
VSQFERFFRAVGSIDIDKDDLKRYLEFVNLRIYDMLLAARDTAQANGRDLVEPWDLAITTGLQESIHRFQRLDGGQEVEQLLTTMVTSRPQDVVCSVETEARLPRVGGGLTVALAETLKIMDAKVVNPSTAHWERAFRIFERLL